MLFISLSSPLDNFTTIMTGRPTALLSSDGPSSDLEPSDLRILRQYVDGSLALDDAANQLTRPFFHPYAIWSQILRLAKEDVDTHQAFVKLINAIFALGKPEWSQQSCEFGANWQHTHDSKSNNNIIDNTHTLARFA